MVKIIGIIMAIVGLIVGLTAWFGFDHNMPFAIAGVVVLIVGVVALIVG